MPWACARAESMREFHDFANLFGVYAFSEFSPLANWPIFCSGMMLARVDSEVPGGLFSLLLLLLVWMFLVCGLAMWSSTGFGLQGWAGAVLLSRGPIITLASSALILILVRADS